MTNDKNIAIIGAGYVGGPTGVILANKCPEYKVYVCDIDAKRIADWQSDNLPVNEPQLDDYLKLQLNKNLFFTTNVDDAVKNSDLVFLCINTPTKDYGIGENIAHNFAYLESALRQIAECATTPKVIVQKSTVPVRSCDMFLDILNASCKKLKPLANGLTSHQLLSNPEFLAEGTAIENTLNPDRVIIGGSTSTPEGKLATDIVKDIFAHWVPPNKIQVISLWSAELCKIASNAFLAQRVSSINSFSMICEKSGADIREVSQAIGLDLRIGNKFLQAGIGFGGSCFAKDLKSLTHLAESLCLPEVSDYWNGVLGINDLQVERFVARIHRAMFQNLAGKKIVIFGYAFKVNTNDTRESQSIIVARRLLKDKADLKIYDPLVSEEHVKQSLIGYDQVGSYEVIKTDQITAAVDGAHALVFCTDSAEFLTLNFEDFYKRMKKPAYIFDGRLFMNQENLKRIGFRVFAVGCANSSE